MSGRPTMQGLVGLRQPQSRVKGLLEATMTELRRNGGAETFRVLLSLSFPLRNKVPVETSIFLFKRPLGLDGHVYEAPWTTVADR